jgi:S-DNA-T family DNA segregation ATPase FtsK/SpoIIIE
MAAGTDDGVLVGLAEADLRRVGFDLTTDDQHFMVFGDAGAGKTSFLRSWMVGLTERYSAHEIRLVLFDYRRSLLAAVPNDYLGAYAGDAESAGVYAEQVAAKLRERMPPRGVTAQELRARSWWEGAEIYVVVDDYDLVGSGAQAPLSRLAEFVPHAREVGLHIVTARRVSGMARASMSDPLMSRVRDLGAGGLVMSGDPREGPVVGDERAVPRPAGRGVLMRRGKPNTLIQVAVHDDREEFIASAGARA